MTPMTKCLLIVPRFSQFNYWNYSEVCELLGASYPVSPLGLITLAALLPQDWDIRLLDLNVHEMDTAAIDWADIVMTGGMIPQQRNILSLIALCHEHEKRVVIGGQDPTSQPDIYSEADFLVLDEGEMTVPMFLADLNAGVTRGVYRSGEKPDITRSPVPRFDLLDLEKYLQIGIQFSRGCPFNCEFCDIIELYGRRPRTKTPSQMIRELDTIFRLGYRGYVEIVDDNFIGNRKNAMAFLAELLPWSRKRAFPFYFGTEASINLADDPKLIALMQSLDFRYVFIGIETTGADLLTLTQKKQNARRPIVESVHRLYSHGMVVNGGFIVGFDGETRDIAQSMAACIEDAAISIAMVGLLAAFPNTQLTLRLAREGRLPDDRLILRPGDTDQSTFGLNFAPLRPSTEVLEDFASVLRRLYSPKNYFDRTLLAASLLRRKHWRIGSTRGLGRELVGFFLLVWKLGLKIETVYFLRNFLVVLFTRPRNVEAVAHLMAMYIHFRKQTPFVLKKIEERIAKIKKGRETTAETPPAFFETSTTR